MRKKWIWLAPLAIVALLGFIVLGGWVVMRLWNWLLPPLFGWHQITLWQGIGMLALCRILFGGFGFHDGQSGQRRRKHGHRDAMTPEERERIRQHLGERWGGEPSPGETQA